MNNNKRFTLIKIIGLLLVIIVISILSFGRETSNKKVKIGVILPGSSDEAGWNGVHYNGIKKACDELDIDMEVYENVSEYSGGCEIAIRKMAKKGIKIIFLESFNYPDEVIEVIKEFPDISFYCCSSELDISNYTAYFARVYQARYLSGIIAGMETKTNNIGYVAAMNNCEVNRGINAFTLGVKSVNPDATVYVSFTDSWDNESKEREEVNALYSDCNVDIVSYHQNQPFVVDEAIKLGINAIGYNIDRGSYPDRLITSVQTDWKVVYEAILSNFIQKKPDNVNRYWIGIEKDAVRLSFYSDMVSDKTKEAVQNAYDEILDNKEIFSGVIYDNKGNRICNENEVIKDEMLLKNMDWFVEGVVEYDKN